MTLAYAAVLAGVAILTVVGSDNLAVIGAVMLLMLRSLSYGQQLAAAAGLAGRERPVPPTHPATPSSGIRPSPASAGQVTPVA